MSRKINNEGLSLIKYFEGLQLTAYKDIVGRDTIGYGHTGPEAIPGRIITESEASKLLECDLEKFETGVNNLLTGLPVSDNAFSSLISFAFNLGLGNLATSTLLRLVNKNNWVLAAEEFPKWCHAGGKEIPGLLVRRRAERDLFLKKDV